MVNGCNSRRRDGREPRRRFWVEVRLWLRRQLDLAKRQESVFRETFELLRRRSVSTAVNGAWRLYWKRQWKGFEQMREALGRYADLSDVGKLLDFRPYPRWLYPIHDWLETRWPAFVPRGISGNVPGR
jgi:hypothetical protein